MKFIRDIIAEKTNMSEEVLSDPVIRDHQIDLSGELDPVDMVASGGLSLSREGHRAYRTEGADLGNSVNGGADPAQGGDQDGGDDFDLLSETQDSAEPTGSTDRPEASELFADIWSDDGIDEDEAGDEGADPEEDIFATDVPDSDAEMTRADEMSFNDAPAPMKETNTEAVMRTMHQPQSELPNDRAEIRDPNSDMPSTIAENSAESLMDKQADKPQNSAFQAIMRRQQSMPSEPEPVATGKPQAEAAHEPMEPIHVPAPAAGRARRQAGRVKTRLLGFSSDDGGGTDLFAASNAATPAVQTMFPVGWIVVASGPGRGNSFALFNGVSQIGRGEDQALRLDFGDSSISRSNHAAIAYDPEQKGFYLGHGGKANLVRLNNRPVLSTEPLETGALIRIGETTLRFVALCSEEFDWADAQEGEGSNAQFG